MKKVYKVGINEMKSIIKYLVKEAVDADTKKHVESEIEYHTANGKRGLSKEQMSDISDEYPISMDDLKDLVKQYMQRKK